MWQQYKDAVNQLRREGKEVEIPGLNEVVRTNILNLDTRTIMQMCIAKTIDSSQEKEFLPGTYEFMALLGTDNCKSTVFMLMNHAGALGKKNIEKMIIKGTKYIRIKLGRGAASLYAEALL